MATIRRQATASPLDHETWKHLLDEHQVPGRDTIVHAIQHGVPLSLEDIPFPGVRVPNHPLLYFDLDRVKEAVAKEERLGRYVKLPPTTDPRLLNLSAMGIAPRFETFEARRTFESHIHRYRPCLKRAAADDFSGGPVSAGPGLAFLVDLNGKVKWRLIHDLSHPEGLNANSFVESPFFDLPAAVRFARRLSVGAFLWKGDIDSAFRIVPVRERDWPLLAFHIDGVLYVDTRLPFGHALSPYYFINFVGRPVLYVAVRRGASLLGLLSAYVDDFFGGCDDYDKAIDQMRLWLRVCADLGVPVSQAKTFLPTQVLEILGFIIDTRDMTISVSRDRIQDVLDEMSYLQGRKSVQKRDLERLAGKMTFICSVVPGGRTFMRELLDTMHALRSKRHWAHLSHGFRNDMAWWQQFAHQWNGTEAIPPPVTVPWHFLSSDASGGEGIGVFLFGAALHIPLALAQHSSNDEQEQELIIAETELIAAVLLVALAAPLVPGEHLMLGIDNTNAVSWIDRGTCRRPRAMRALRVLWRLQAQYRVHVSTRYVPSERNVLADAASRLDFARFSSTAARWRSTHASTLSALPFVVSESCTSLHVAPYGPAGGAAGHLVQLLVEGHPCGVWNPESQVDRILHEISTHAHRLVAQQPDRLRHVLGDHSQAGPTTVVQHDQGLRGLLGESHRIHTPVAAQPSSASGSPTVSTRRGSSAGQEGGQGGAVPARSPPGHQPLGSGQPDGPTGTDDCDAGALCFLGMPSPRQPRSKDGEQACVRADRTRCPVSEQCRNPHGTRLEDHSICGTDPPSGAPSPARPALVPVSRISAVDLAAATPIVPDNIVRAVFDNRRSPVSFGVFEAGEPAHPPIASPHGPLVPSWLREASVRARRVDLADHASWRLEDPGGRHVVRRGHSDSQPHRSAHVTVGPGVDPP